ncbi:MAG: hypothetical protein LQ346_003244 [Caloplaca aetnensis]|nr:MAG: hypothetical protein LQ346_003244 [Caloplaca aetnensis]
MAESLEDRLRSHAKAFDGLLSLIPAKLYYGEDTSDQWQRKKQTKEEARAAKIAKLDPANSKSAKDVLDERAEQARKRKREEDDDESEVEGVVSSEAPIQGSKSQKKKAKKQKREDKGGKIDKGISSGVAERSDADPKSLSHPANPQALKDKKAREAEEKKLRAERKRAKAERKKQARQNPREADKGTVTELSAIEQDQENLEASNSENDNPRNADIDRMDVSGLSNQPQGSPTSTASSSPTPDSPAFDHAAVLSGSSSVSSIVPPAIPETTHPEKPIQETTKPKIDHAELEARLRRRIEELRASRNADGLNGKPAKTRQELIEARRQKAEQSKAHKKELRRKEKQEAERKEAENLARGSPLLSPAAGSLLSPSPSSERPDTNNFSFGRIAFADGQQASTQLSSLIDPKHKVKGPQDPLTALRAAQNKQSRINGLDENKREDIAEKDMWLNARKRAHGERIRDDTSLLKKTLKRKEKQKKKSEKEWGERLEGVRKAGEVKQKKRDDNLAKRREEKGKKGKKGPKHGKKKRPGFEGSMRTKAPRK